QLERPRVDLAVRVLHVDVEVAVGIGRLDLRHGPGELDRFVGVVLGGERVMRDRGNRAEQETGERGRGKSSHHLPPVGADRRAESRSFSRQNSSIMFMSMVNGFVYALGSSTVTWMLSVPKFGRVIRSVVVAASVIGLPGVSSHWSSRKPFVVTTNVSPSHLPME